MKVTSINDTWVNTPNHKGVFNMSFHFTSFLIGLAVGYMVLPAVLGKEIVAKKAAVAE